MWTETINCLWVCVCVYRLVDPLCVSVYTVCICVFQCQAQGQLQECVSAVRVCLARLDYVIQVHTTTQPPFLSQLCPSPTLSLLSVFSPWLSSSFLSSLFPVTSVLHLLFLPSHFLPLLPSTSYPSLLLLSPSFILSVILVFSAPSFLCQAGVSSLISQLAS